MNTPESLKKTISDGIQSNLVFVHDDYQFMLEKLWNVVFETTLAMQRSSAALEAGIPEKDHAVLLILANCVVDLQATHQSMLSGFHRASAIVGRGLLENLAVAVSIKADESGKVFEQYKAGTLLIPKAIGYAKKQYPAIGPVYGVLTKKFAHEKYESLGRAFIQKDNTTMLLLVPPVGQNDFLIQFVLIANLGVLAGLLGLAIEWAFAQWVEPTVLYKKTDDNQLTLRESLSKKSNIEIAAKLETKLQTRKSSEA